MRRIEPIIMLAVVSGCAQQDTTLPAAGAHVAITSTGKATAERTDAHLISSSGIGAIRLSMTVGDAMRSLPTARFSRASDGDGLALVEVTLGTDTALTLYANEEDAEAPIDTSKRITRIETFSPAFYTVEGVRPGALVRDVEVVFGPTREIVKSEIESREFIEFEKQPAFLTLRLDYTGLFPEGARTTREYEPDAKILSIAIVTTRR